MIRRILFALLALLLVTGAAACGGGGGGDDEASDERADDGSSATSDTLPTAEEEAADDEAASGEDGDQAGGDDSGDTDPPAEGRPGSVATELGVDRTFTGEGSDELCDAMDDIQSSAEPDLGQADFADQMAAITPPAEIAAEWETMHTVLKAIASDPSGEALASMSQEELDEWTMANSVIAAYLGDVCGLAE